MNTKPNNMLFKRELNKKEHVSVISSQAAPCQCMQTMVTQQQCEHTRHCHLWFYCGFTMSCKNSHQPLCSSRVWVQPHHVDQLKYHVKPQQQAHRGVLKRRQESQNLVGSQVVVVVSQVHHLLKQPVCRKVSRPGL